MLFRASTGLAQELLGVVADVARWVVAGDPVDEVVDESGCSASERDGDGDGLVDAEDSCPSTSANETVASDGLAIVGSTEIIAEVGPAAASRAEYPAVRRRLEDRYHEGVP